MSDSYNVTEGASGFSDLSGLQIFGFTRELLFQRLMCYYFMVDAQLPAARRASLKILKPPPHPWIVLVKGLQQKIEIPLTKRPSTKG